MDIYCMRNSSSPSPSSKLSGHVAAFVRSLIGDDKLFATQVALATRADLNPSTVYASMHTKRAEPETLSKLASVLDEEMQRKLITAAVLDAVPEPYVGLLFREGEVELDERMSPISPLAEAYLKFLARESRRDPTVVAMLEKQAMWVGLDKEVGAR
jgi:hypothetical protein